MLQLLQTGRPPSCRGSQPHWRCASEASRRQRVESSPSEKETWGGEARLPPQADPQIRQATGNDVSEPSRYMPPNSQSPLPVEVIDPEASPNRDAPSGVAERTAPLTPITEQYEFDEELPVEVIGPEASPNRDAPSGVAEHTAALTPITEQYELLAWIANAFHQAPPDQLQGHADVSRNNTSQTAKVLTMTSDKKNSWTHSFGTFSGRGSKASAANFRKDTASGPLRCGRVRMSWTCCSPS